MENNKRMGHNKLPIGNDAELRRKAEERVSDMSEKADALSSMENRKMLHELRVHQVELSMQNEVLRESQAETDTARAKYFDLYDRAPVGYCTISKKGMILQANLTAATLLGVPKNAMIQKPLSNFIFSEDQELYYLHLIQLFKTGERQICDLRMVKQDGNMFWVHLEAVVDLQDRDGETENPEYRLVITDITERKQAEEENAGLQKQLIQAQKMESIGRLAGGIAHNFNNMLFVILGNTEIALDRLDPADLLHENLTEIHNATQRSAKLTRQILAFARKESVAPIALNLNETVEEMLKMLRCIIGEDMELVWRPGNNLWSVKIDPSQIDQILANLCANARDAISGVGKVVIELKNRTIDTIFCSTHMGSLPGDYVLLSFSDNGCGMDKETLNNIFEPFFTTKAFGLGSGLGLATLYGIVKQNLGFINVQSEPGQGTTFNIYLPRYVDKSVTIQREESTESINHGHETILLVEDELAILKMSKMMLERSGYTALSAETPGKAIQLALENSQEIHLLMTDVVMPEMSGKDLAEKIKAVYPNIRLLFMSGYTADVIAHNGILEEGIHFIQKPFSMHELTAKMRGILTTETENVT